MNRLFRIKPTSRVYFRRFCVMAEAAKAKSDLLQNLRLSIKEHDAQAFLIPHDDAHMSEYICSHDERIQFASNFGGSAGTVLVTLDTAHLWTDGRYFLAAEKSLPDTFQLMKQGQPKVPTIPEYCQENKISKLLVDPFLTSIGAKDSYKDVELVYCKENPLDKAWTDQPPVPQFEIFDLSVNFAGQSREDKIKLLREKLLEDKCKATVICALDQICWVLNLRGKDIPYNPVFFAYLLVTETTCTLYIDEKKVSSELQKSLSPLVTIATYESIRDLDPSKLFGDQDKVLLDPDTTNLFVYNLFKEDKVVLKMNPIESMKSVKNDTELKGMRDCHIRDGVAKTRWIYWLTQEMKKGTELTEYDVAQKLKDFRMEQDHYVSNSFATISSTAGNGAIIHYHPTENECSPLEKAMFLVDSGAQYLDGTTDVTRTVHFGDPTEFEKKAYTSVLKGHIRLAMARFPSGTKGPALDAFARSALWELGLDYNHGTGHGVGCFLNVHEGPIGLSASTFRKKLYENGLEPGMIISNEPGYYERGKFGIRIENLVIVKEADTEHSFMDKTFCEFETITIIPLARDLIVVKMLEDKERKWVDEYHDRCWCVLSGSMETDEETSWLREQTMPL